MRKTILAASLAAAMLFTNPISLAAYQASPPLMALMQENAPGNEEPEEEQKEEEEKRAEKTTGAAEKRTKPITKFERQLVEIGFRLLPYDHPFVIAYERTYGTDIHSYAAEINGVTVSGVPFEFGGKGDYKGFNENWWRRTGVGQYPVGGLDCAKYLSWIYLQAGIVVPDVSNALFFSGTTGVTRTLSGVRPHMVLPSLEHAMIGDIAYNSKNQTYHSGHGSHVQMYLGTANVLGISRELQKMYPDFPCDAHLVLDCGWSDGEYYYRLMRKLKVHGARRGMAGVGVQFFTSIKSGSAFIYKSPQKVYAWKNPDTGNTFQIESRLEKNGRLLQYKPGSKIEHTINISRPILRNDA
ncbi:MAG: C40 family peptidase [Clostridiales bacterium]|jgi:cell wall-associated NlpC family hydrolase|nr:C40 family peptidase [Clostridiales bacterium]